MKIYDSYDGRIKEFVPVNEGKVHMYVCGLTPYDRMHVGHLRTYVFFDVVRRYLEHKGYEVFYVQNVTDVEDKVFKRAAEMKIHPLELTKKNMDEALREMDALNIRRPTLLERVSENVPVIISLIKRIIANGYAYESSGDVYFSVMRFSGYGTLSKQKIDALMSGARVEPGEKKHNPLDFALWKESKENEVVFDSPWGRGRPGWHIECSAISTKYLGETIDIHGGGIDLIFPHHENEVAQSEAATGKRFVNYWMHTGFLTINGEKMSKSLGNFITVKDILARYEPNVIRWYLLTRHYRSPIDFNYDYLDEIKRHVEKVYNCIEFARVAMKRYKGTDNSIEEAVEKTKVAFYNAMDDDFDTPAALVAVNELVHELNKRLEDERTNGDSIKMAVEELLTLCGVMGIEMQLKKDDGYVKALDDVCKKYSVGAGADLYAIVESLLSLRERMRKEKKYGDADAIREALKNASIVVEDIGGISLWRRG